MTPQPQIVDAIDPEEAAFLAAIRSSPGEVMNRLAYADWLDERGRSTQAADERRIAPGMRVLTATKLTPFLMDWSKSSGTPSPGCEGIWYGWTYPENRLKEYRRSVIPSEEWYSKIYCMNEYPVNKVYPWCYFRCGAESLAAEAFALLSPNEQDRLLQLAADHERRASLPI